MQRRRHRVFRQQAQRLPRLDGLHAHFRTGADAAEFDGAGRFGRGLKYIFQAENTNPGQKFGVNFFDPARRIF